MRLRPLLVLPLSLFFLSALPGVERSAIAQFTPGGMGPMPGPGGGPPAPGEEKQGPAEQAPKQEGAAEAAATPGWPASADASSKFIEIDGNMRLRSDYYHQLDLGLLDGQLGHPTPFPAPIDCWKAPSCGNNDISSSDMRLRLEPTINLTESVRVKTQIDVLDNSVLGSTPQGMFINPPVSFSRNGWTPVNAFSRTQVSPEAGLNSLGSSIHAQRAWAEVRTALGQLEFGRMPSNWGLGILANDGECLDCNFGDNADRVLFATKVSGLLLVAGRDWVADGPTTSITSQFATQYIGGEGQPFELYNPADVRQYFAVVGELDKPAEFQAKLDRGDAVLNWGFYGIYRWQYYDYSPDLTIGQTPEASSIVHDNAWAVIPDGYFHFGWDKLDLQAELVGIYGKIGPLPNISTSISRETVEQAGGVLRGEYRLLGADLVVGTEIGYASGDQAESVDNNPNVFNSGPVLQPPGDTTITNFRFNPDFQPDQILFRQILGTVTNATYIKPYIAYYLTRPTAASPRTPEIMGRVDIESAFANSPVSTPGNGIFYGTEPDVQVTYYDHNSGFSATLIYAALFPGDALSRPAGIWGPPPNPSNPLASSYGGSAQIAQTVRLILAVQY